MEIHYFDNQTHSDEEMIKNMNRIIVKRKQGFAIMKEIHLAISHRYSDLFKMRKGIVIPHDQ